MHTHPFEPYWPVARIREEGVYFYGQAIETYHEDEHVSVAEHGRMALFGSYSYLALNGHPRIDRAAQDAISRYGTGAHGARLLAGTLEIHRELEAELARFKGTESAVTFSSGYAANVSTITSLVGRHDTVICDKLNHASIVDGCSLSRAKLVRFRHNDMDHLAACLADPANPGHKLVIVDAVFSMDGDVINLPEVSRLCRQHGALLMVDEAHALGMLGSSGRGIEEHFGLPSDTIDVKMGTLSKAIPSVGGYIAGSRRLCDFLAHQGRGFIYSGALPAPAAAAALEALRVIQDEPERLARLHGNVRHFAAALRAIGLAYVDGATAIFPVICGEDWAAFRLAHFCQQRGFYVQGVPHPVVPKNSARLRVSITAGHHEEQLDRFVAVLDQGLDELAISRDGGGSLEAPHRLGRGDRSRAFCRLVGSPAEHLQHPELSFLRWRSEGALDVVADAGVILDARPSRALAEVRAHAAPPFIVETAAGAGGRGLRQNEEDREAGGQGEDSELRHTISFQ